MTYKLTWKPTFKRQIKSVLNTDDFAEDLPKDAVSCSGGDEGPVKAPKQLLWQMVRPFRSRILLLLSGTVLLQALNLTGVLIGSDTLSENPYFDVWVAAFLFIAIRVLFSVVFNQMAFRGNTLAASITSNLVERIGKHVAQLAPEAKNDFSSGNLKTMAITDATAVGSLVHSVASRGVGFLISPLVAAPILYWLVGWPGIWAFFCLLLMIPFSILVSKKNAASL